MVCPKCKGKVKVKDSVNVLPENKIYRQKVCTKCGYQFFTEEFVRKHRDQLFVKDWCSYHR